MYQPTWINRTFQFNRTVVDLLLEDDEGLLPTQRFPMSFPGEPVLSTLAAAASARRALLLDEIANPPLTPTQMLAQRLNAILLNMGINPVNRLIFIRDFIEQWQP